MKYILNISIYLSLHAMISMWSVFYTYSFQEEAALQTSTDNITILVS